MNREQTLRELIENALNPTEFRIIDDSAKHIGHAGNTGGSHFTIHIACAQFEDLNTVACHRLIYAAVNDLIPNEIHALSINIIK